MKKIIVMAGLNYTSSFANFEVLASSEMHLKNINANHFKKANVKGKKEKDFEKPKSKFHK